jgi:NADH-quinone oxidoreductase subunit M
MLNHGISTGALFLLVGMIYERRHTREISEFGGITKVMPLFAVAFLIVTLSSVALPGTNGFVGEFLILLGTWKASQWTAVVAGTGVIFGAVYMLWMFQRVMFGPIKNPENETLKDLSLREVLVLLPLLVMAVWMGIQPNLFFNKMDASVTAFLDRAVVKAAVVEAAPAAPAEKTAPVPGAHDKPKTSEI